MVSTPVIHVTLMQAGNSDISRDVTGTVGHCFTRARAGKKRDKQLKKCLLINGSFTSIQDFILKLRQITDFDVLFLVALMIFR